MDQLVMQILCQLRTMQLFYHNSHHAVKGAVFEGDHELFGAFYPEMDANYDDVAERYMGLFGKSLDLPAILVKVYHKVLTVNIANPQENKELFVKALSLETELQALADQVDKSLEASAGLKQLIGNISDQSESRTYKIKQRLK